MCNDILHGKLKSQPKLWTPATLPPNRSLTASLPQIIVMPPNQRLSGYVRADRDYNIICPQKEEGSSLPTRLEAPKQGIAGYSGK